MLRLSQGSGVTGCPDQNESERAQGWKRRRHAGFCFLSRDASRCRGARGFHSVPCGCLCVTVLRGLSQSLGLSRPGISKPGTGRGPGKHSGNVHESKPHGGRGGPGTFRARPQMLPALRPETLCGPMRERRRRGRPRVWQLRGHHPQCGGHSKPGSETVLSGQAGFLPVPSAKQTGQEGRGGGAGRGERQHEELWALALEWFPAVETPAPTTSGTGALAWILGKRTPHPSLGEQPRNGVSTLLGPTCGGHMGS